VRSKKCCTPAASYAVAMAETVSRSLLEYERKTRLCRFRRTCDRRLRQRPSSARRLPRVNASTPICASSMKTRASTTACFTSASASAEKLKSSGSPCHDAALNRAIAYRRRALRATRQRLAPRGNLADFHAARRGVRARIDLARRFDHRLQILRLVNDNAHEFRRAAAQLLWRERRRIRRGAVSTASRLRAGRTGGVLGPIDAKRRRRSAPGAAPLPAALARAPLPVRELPQAGASLSPPDAERNRCARVRPSSARAPPERASARRRHRQKVRRHTARRPSHRFQVPERTQNPPQPPASPAPALLRRRSAPRIRAQTRSRSRRSRIGGGSVLRWHGRQRMRACGVTPS
jgi:hypothetical protein